ncbi:MAG: hypothetical protein L0Y56_15205 [Nitrospira sp.]|nr:hypothetical protein [Nitrospira sp.]
MNPKKLVFLKLEGQEDYNENGEILDGWGYVLAIKINKTGKLSIHSFGRNKTDDGGKGDDIFVEYDL